MIYHTIHSFLNKCKTLPQCCAKDFLYKSGDNSVSTVIFGFYFDITSILIISQISSSHQIYKRKFTGRKKRDYILFVINPCLD